MRSAEFRAWPRVAWLMLSVRMLGSDQALTGRRELMGRLRGGGLPIDLTRISRFESGHHPVPGRVLLAYETVLGQTPGSFLALSRALVRNSSATPPVPDLTPYVDDASDLSSTVDALLDQATAISSDAIADSLTGGEWLRLAVELNRLHPIYLHSDVWSRLCGQLVQELARDSGAEFQLRYEACVALITHPIAQRPMLRALGEWLTDPDIQVAHPMIALLGEIRDEAANELALRLLGSRTPVLAEGAVSVVAAKLARGQFADEGVARVGQYVVQRTASEGRVTIDDIDLLVQLPGQTARRVVAATRDQHLQRRMETALDHRTLTAPTLSKATAKGIVANAQRDTPSPIRHETDQMLHTLVEEALFHVHGVRRDLAVRTLALSPYAGSISDSCLALARSAEPLVASRGLAVAVKLDRRSRDDELAGLSHDLATGGLAALP